MTIKTEIKDNLFNAINEGDSEAFIAAQIEMAKEIEQNIIKEAKAMNVADMNDEHVLAERGMQPLTKDEKEYYNEVIEGKGFAGVQKLMPPTIFDRVFEYLEREHPLLSEIDFVNTTGTTRWITRKGDAEAAWWGPLCDEIKKKLESAFEINDTELFKLSAYVPVCKSMLDLGPVWLDRFVRTLLQESLAIALEEAIVNGDGKEKPIGMGKDLKGSVVEGVYPDKKAIKLDNFTPFELGEKVMKPLTLEGKRAATNVLLIVNPDDYWGKLFGATTMLTQNGVYVYDILPIPAKIIQSTAVKKGTMIAGMGKDYFMGVGSGQKIEYSDHYKFLEDERTYIAKQYANGYPIENDRFIVFDISDISGEPQVPNTPQEPAAAKK